MYKRNVNGWMKHIDFLVLDIIMLEIALLLANWLRNGLQKESWIQVFQGNSLLMILIACCATFLLGTYNGILRRGYWKEFQASVLYVSIVAAGILLYWYLSRSEMLEYSRLAFTTFLLLANVFVYVERILLKNHLTKRKKENAARRMLLIATKDDAEDLVRTVTENNFADLYIMGIIIVDQDMTGQQIHTLPIVASAADAADYIRQNWVDEVFVDFVQPNDTLEGLLEQCKIMGITLHVKLMKQQHAMGNETLEKVAGYSVLSSSINIVTPREMFFKRAMDICAGLVGCLVTGIIFIFLAPAIYITSPGPIFFAQTRVGKNGRKFKIYKFRSMYIDAEERKKELMKNNKMSGLMFKMDADPRILGSGPDGTRHGLGWFIRTFSIDEFPQFFNILKGDMSLIGTRPPTVDEWEAYELHHRARLAVRPGLTGMWQVSGRSNITDFEEVVKLDMEYIRNWSLALDFRIILKTIVVVLKGVGSE
ncbi:MAG: sugar transferase [Lachnospiraceae bacterium]|nr:sugar transferase [Lachnospiraceae bacterium]